MTERCFPFLPIIPRRVKVAHFKFFSLCLLPFLGLVHGFLADIAFLLHVHLWVLYTRLQTHHLQIALWWELWSNIYGKHWECLTMIGRLSQPLQSCCEVKIGCTSHARISIKLLAFVALNMNKWNMFVWLFPLLFPRFPFWVTLTIIWSVHAWWSKPYFSPPHPRVRTGLWDRTNLTSLLKRGHLHLQGILRSIYNQ